MLKSVDEYHFVHWSSDVSTIKWRIPQFVFYYTTQMSMCFYGFWCAKDMFLSLMSGKKADGNFVIYVSFYLEDSYASSL